MAKRRRSGRRRSGRRRKGGSSVLKRVVVALVLLAPIGYFAFTKVFFDPFEEPQRPFPTLVPRDVDLYLRRENLVGDFSDFPMPRWLEKLRLTQQFRELERTGWYQGLGLPDTLASFADTLEESLAEAPVDPLGDVLGREVVVMAEVPPSGAPSFGVLARVTNKAKLLTELGSSQKLLDKAAPGAEVTEIRDDQVPEVLYRRVAVPGEEPFYFGRSSDLIVFAEKEWLVRDVLRNSYGGGEQTLGATRLYGLHLPPEPSGLSDAVSIEYQLDMGRALTNLGAPTDLAVRSDDALTNIARRLLDPTLLADMVGRLDLGRAVRVRGHAELDHTRTPEARTGLLGTETFEVRDRLQRTIEMLPSDTTGFVTMNVDIRELLETLHEALDPELVKLLDDFVRDLGRYTPTWQLRTLQDLYPYFDRMLDGEVTIMFRPLDHEIPKGSQPLPLLAFYMPIRNLQMWLDLDDAVIRGYKVFGLDPDKMKKQEEGVGLRKWFGLTGVSVSEVSYIVLDEEIAVIATSNDLLREIVRIYTGSWPSLADEHDVSQVVDGVAMDKANFAAWVDSERLRTVLEPYAPWIAEDETRFDFVSLRAAEVRKFVASHHPEYRGREDELPEDVEEVVQAEVDDLLKAMEDERVRQVVPQRASEWLDGFSWMSLLEDVMTVVRLGERTADVELTARTVVR